MNPRTLLAPSRVGYLSGSGHVKARACSDRERPRVGRPRCPRSLKPPMRGCPPWSPPPKGTGSRGGGSGATAQGGRAQGATRCRGPWPVGRRCHGWAQCRADTSEKLNKVGAAAASDSPQEPRGCIACSSMGGGPAPGAQRPGRDGGGHRDQAIVHGDDQEIIVAVVGTCKLQIPCPPNPSPPSAVVWIKIAFFFFSKEINSAVVKWLF